MGRDPYDAKLIKEYIEGGFKIEVAGFQKSSMNSKDPIVSQTPAPNTKDIWTKTRNDGLIKVIFASRK